jgi:Na+-transporting NADH:ubiquinone oxidoreductase subunit NqrB
MVDPRNYQIATLSGLLAYGMARLGFDIEPTHVCFLLGSVLITQAVCDGLAKRTTGKGWPMPNLRSALISGLSLCLLLRTDRPELAVAAGVLTIAGKFLIRFDNKHIFNPTNGGIVAMLLLTKHVWVSPGQWGAAATLGFLIACAGSLVVYRASRSDVTFAFLAFYAVLLIGRSLYLQEPVAIPLHRLQSGALLLFAFFMISDPKTTPNSRMGRVLFGLLVASVAWFIQFRLFGTNGPLWALALCSPMVPVINGVLPGPTYMWAASRPTEAAAAPRKRAFSYWGGDSPAGLRGSPHTQMEGAGQ